MSCPVNSTCRAFGEGMTVAARKGLAQDEPRDVPGLVDMEDVCGICSDWDMATSEDVTGAAGVVGAGDQPKGPSRRSAKRPEQAQVLSSIAPRSPNAPGRKGQHDNSHALSPEATEVAISHARRFPIKVSKKPVREEETVVCAVRRTSDGCYLIQKRPDKGEPSTKENTKIEAPADLVFRRASRGAVGTTQPDTARL